VFLIPDLIGKVMQITPEIIENTVLKDGRYYVPARVRIVDLPPQRIPLPMLELKIV